MQICRVFPATATAVLALLWVLTQAFFRSSMFLRLLMAEFMHLTESIGANRVPTKLGAMTWLANVGNASILSVSIDSSVVCFTASSSEVYVMACTTPAKQHRARMPPFGAIS
jgi:hypothetical protein